MLDLENWLDAHSRRGFVWFAKRLSGNDTLANGTHQAGPCIPRDLLLRLLPALNRPERENPDIHFDLDIASHGDRRRARAVWYNNALRGGTRNEARITNLGGTASALLDPENTGALCVFVFEPGGTACSVWVCRDAADEEVVQDRIGPTEPGKWRLWHPAGDDAGFEEHEIEASCRLAPEQMPPEWLEKFPSPMELVDKAAELRPGMDFGVDRRLISRRDCEFELFRSVEQAVELPKIREFGGRAESVEAFVMLAQPILQRRKARSGRSLELHTRRIFIEEGLEEGRQFSWQAESEPGHRPDFLFPSAEAYRNRDFPAERLRMLAVKTTCRDRWRQILNEAARIERKNLLTLQEGVSESQFREMTEAGVQLVVPEPLAAKFPASVRPRLLTLDRFVGQVRDGV